MFRFMETTPESEYDTAVHAQLYQAVIVDRNLDRIDKILSLVISLDILWGELAL